MLVSFHVATGINCETFRLRRTSWSKHLYNNWFLLLRKSSLALKFVWHRSTSLYHILQSCSHRMFTGSNNIPHVTGSVPLREWSCWQLRGMRTHRQVASLSSYRSHHWDADSLQELLSTSRSRASSYVGMHRCTSLYMCMHHSRHYSSMATAG